MSFITRCPACSTMFKVVPDQLRISDGWVRCGQCDEVFNANENLRSLFAAPDFSEPSAPSPAPVVEPAAEAPVQEPPAPLPPQVPDDAPEDSFPAFVAPAAPEPEPQPAPEPEEEPVAAVRESKSRFMEVDQGVSDVVPRERKKPTARRTADVPKPSFMRSTTPATRSVWQRTAVRVALSCACVIALLGLLAQVSMHERDRIAAVVPLTKPWLVQLCHVADCEVQPLRDIDAIVIDSSSFTKLRAQVHQLSATVKNTVRTEIAIPSLELTLTNLQDQPVTRRVVYAHEFAPQHLALKPGAELVVSVPVRVLLSESSERVSGYRLVAFYP